MRGRGPLSPAEYAQLDAELPSDPEWAAALAEDEQDRAFRRKVWIAMLCGLAAFWIIAAGTLALIGAE